MGLRHLPPAPNENLRLPCSSVSLESPVCAQDDASSVKREKKNDCVQPVASTLDRGGRFLCTDGDIVVVLDTGVAANLVRARRLRNHNLLLGRQ